MNHSVVFLLFVVSGAVLGQVSDEELRQQIDTFVNEVLQCTSVPGASLAIVRDGQVFHTNGYGVMDNIGLEPVTDSTLMGIASLSKHFAATTMAKALETNPGYDWGDTVRSILGNTFYLSDGYMSNRATITDLLSHRVGIGLHDLNLLSGRTIDDTISHFRFLESTTDFRDGDTYNNLMYLLADRVIQAISGRASWEDILQESFLDPLGMTSTTFVTREEDWGDLATSYMFDGFQLREVSKELAKAYTDTSTALGGVSSNAIDMAKWIMFHLSGGRAPGGEELIDPGLLDDTHDHCGVTGDVPLFQYPTDPVTYDRNSKAMGWFEGFYREYYVQGHGGLIAGYDSQIFLFPEVGLGMYSTLTTPVLQDADSLIHMYIADLLLNETAWLDSETVCNMMELEVYGPRDQSREIQRTHRSLLEPYEGTFGHFGYGNVTIYINSTSGGLEMEYGPGPNVRWNLVQQSNTTFSANAQGIHWFVWNELNFEDVGGGNYDCVVINFDLAVPPTFQRNLNMNDAPPPPTLC